MPTPNRLKCADCKMNIKRYRRSAIGMRDLLQFWNEATGATFGLSDWFCDRCRIKMHNAQVKKAKDEKQKEHADTNWDIEDNLREIVIGNNGQQEEHDFSNSGREMEDSNENSNSRFDETGTNVEFQRTAPKDAIPMNPFSAPYGSVHGIRTRSQTKTKCVDSTIRTSLRTRISSRTKNVATIGAAVGRTQVLKQTSVRTVQEQSGVARDMQGTGVDVEMEETGARGLVEETGIPGEMSQIRVPEVMEHWSFWRNGTPRTCWRMEFLGK